MGFSVFVKRRQFSPFILENSSPKMHSNPGAFQHGRWRVSDRLRLFPQVFAHRVAFALHMPEHQHTQLISIPAPQRVDDPLMFPHRLAQPVAAN
jgi:hypothetical protein